MNNNTKKAICNCGLWMLLFMVVAMKLFRRERMSCGREQYKLAPTGVEIQEQPGACKSLFELPNQLDCVPGSTPQSSAYTVGLTPGGLCGAQKCVNASSNYKINGGIGGSLLD